MLTAKLENNSKEEKAIITMIVFFDLFDFPLSAFEIWKEFSDSFSLLDIYKFLDNNSKLQEKDGFYFLKNRSSLVAIRKKRYNYTNYKIKIAQKSVRLFKLFPFVKMVAIANVIGSYNLRAGSDIDFFIISQPGYLWLSRLYCTGLAKILNNRPNQKTKKDKICLSFYLSQDHLSLDNLRLQEKDPYLDYWPQGLILLYNKNRVYQDFLKINSKNNLDLKDSLEKKNQKEFNSSWLDSKKKENFFEKGARKFQLKIMPQELREAMNNSDGVVVNNQVLKFYQRDRRQEFADKYGIKIKEVFRENN